MANPTRILLIDDNRDDRTLTLRALRKEFELEAVEVINSQGLEEALRQPSFDLAIIDYKLNWTTGLDLLPAIKQSHSRCAVIMFTGTGSEEIAVAALKQGLDDYVVKSPRHFPRVAAAAIKALKQAKLHRRGEWLEARLTDLLERLDVGVYRISARGGLAYANTAFRRLFALPSGGDTQGWDLGALVADPAEAARLQETLDREGSVRASEVKLRIPGGPELWVSLYQVRRPSGAVEGMIENVSERKRMADALQLREEELQRARKLESVGRLAGGVAHDFNNMLTAINGYAELLAEMAGEDHPFRESLEEIRGAGQRAALLTRQLLAFSRRQLLQPKRMDLNEFIGSLAAGIRAVLGPANRLELSLAGYAVEISADPYQLETAIMNLIANARDAMPEGGTLTLATRNLQVTEEGLLDIDPRTPALLAAGNYGMLEVKDTGIGMSAETQARLFEPFFTTKPQGSGVGKGAGLGLCTTFGIVKQSGGDLFVSSQPGQGTCFTLCLPRSPLVRPEPGTERRSTLIHS